MFGHKPISDISANDLYHGDLETAWMPNAEYRPIESIHEHRAGNPTHCPEDEAVLREAVRTLLED